MALQLSGTLPMVWGTSELAAVAALRFACQLAENAKQPAVHGALTEVHHNQIVTLAGRYGAGAGDVTEDIFRDPLLDGGPTRERLRMLLLRDTAGARAGDPPLSGDAVAGRPVRRRDRRARAPAGSIRSNGSRR